MPSSIEPRGTQDVDAKDITACRNCAGDWNGEQLLPSEWIRASAASDSLNRRSPHYGYYWWLLPVEGEETRYYAEGRFGQFIFVAPDRELVIVRTGGTDGDISWTSLFERIVTRLDAVDRRGVGSGRGEG